MIVREAILSQLDALIAQGEKITHSYPSEPRLTGAARRTQLPEHEVRAFLTSVFAAVERIAGRDSEYYRQLVSIRPGEVVTYAPEIPSAAYGAVLALRDAVDTGLLVHLEAIVRANVYDDLLLQADELLKARYDVAAMVLVGAVLEQHLQKLCIGRSLSWNGAGSLSKYNDLLREVLYDVATWRRLQAIADLRNHAAHGETTLVKVEDVADARKYVMRFLSDYVS
jgi:hypothetical protein